MESPSYPRLALGAIITAIVVTAAILASISIASTTRQRKQSPQASRVVLKDEELLEAYKQGYNTARERLRAHGLLLPIMDEHRLIGIVVNKDAKALLIRQTNLDTDPLADRIPDERRVTVTNQTRIVKQPLISPEEANKNFRDLQNNPDASKIAVGTGSAIPLALSDIPLGATVSVLAQSEVRLAEDVSAIEILVQP